jgi:uncharacterized protein with beta-barrel porin domain
MNRLIRMLIFMSVLTVISLIPAAVPAQEAEGYTYFGSQVCIGQYTPPSTSDVTGVCRGQVLGVEQFSAAAARQSANSLDRIAALLEAMDDKLAANNQQLQQLTGTVANARASAGTTDLQQMSDAIAQRFDSITDEVIDNTRFREVLDGLRADIMSEVEKRLPAPAAK